MAVTCAVHGKPSGACWCRPESRKPPKPGADGRSICACTASVIGPPALQRTPKFAADGLTVQQVVARGELRALIVGHVADRIEADASMAATQVEARPSRYA